jgi:hypothetical protein
MAALRLSFGSLRPRGGGGIATGFVFDSWHEDLG